METTNYYEEKSKRKSKHENSEDNTLANDDNEDKKEDFMGIIKNVMVDAGLSVLGGGFTSAILGRLSLPLGILITGYGHYKKKNALRVLGIGMMASSSMANRTGKNPQAGTMENITERIQAFGEELKSKLGIDLLTRQQAGKKENKSVSDLNGTETKQTPRSSTVSKAKDIETEIPAANLFGSPKAEYLNPQPRVPLKEEKQKYVRDTVNDYLSDLASIEEKLF